MLSTLLQGMELLAELTSLEPAVILNAAFCERHRGNCGTSTQLQRECGKVSASGSAFLLPLPQPPMHNDSSLRFACANLMTTAALPAML